MISETEWRALLPDGLARHRVPGASIAILHEGEVITAVAGLTNVTTGVEMTAETVMLIGSIAKVFNATLVMQLVDEGKVDLDERVLRYLPELRIRDREALERVTVKMLLNHTSGIDGQMLPDQGHDEETIEKGVARFCNLGQTFAPGAEYSYCNAGAVIAGYMAQRLTGKSLYRLIKERIFEPLDLRHSAALPEDALLHRASVGHYLNPGSHPGLARTAFAFLPLSFSPGGTTLMMSALDLMTFARAHLGSASGGDGTHILSCQSAQAMQRKTVDNHGKGYAAFDIGIGWMLTGDGFLHHSGGGPGIVSALYVLIDELTDHWCKSIGIMRSAGSVATASSRDKPTAHFARYVGTYENVSERYLVSQTADGMTLSRQAKFAPYESISTEASRPTSLHPLADEQFLWEPEKPDTPLDESRIVAFLNSDSAGRALHLGNTERLFLRASNSG
jgi:CubicO group peptidase (beta-lactamase class C family)